MITSIAVSEVHKVIAVGSKDSNISIWQVPKEIEDI